MGSVEAPFFREREKGFTDDLGGHFLRNLLSHRSKCNDKSVGKCAEVISGAAGCFSRLKLR